MAVEETDDYQPRGTLDFLKDPWGIVLRRWPWMLATLLLALGATAALIGNMKLRYEAKSTILVTAQQIPEEFVKPTIEENPFQTINAMVGAILSRETIVGLIEKHGLYADLRETETLDAIVSRVREDIQVGAEQGIGMQSRVESARLYAITVQSDSPRIAAEVANDLASRFIDANIRVRTQQARLATEFLKRELATAERELLAHNQRIQDFKREHRGELPSELQANLARLTRLQEQRSSLALQISESETRLAMLSSSQDEASPEARLAALKSRRDQEAAVHTPEHPNVISLERQIQALEQELAAATDGHVSRSALVAASQRGLEELRSQYARTAAEIEDLDERVAQTHVLEEELSALEGTAQVLHDNYSAFLKKVQGAQLAQSLESAQQGERVSVVDRAIPPAQPLRQRWKFAALGLAGAFAAALAAAILLELVDPVLISPEQVEALTDLPVLGSAPRIS